MNIDMSEFIQTFFEEASEHIARMESLLLALNLQAPDPEELNAIFRAAHSIKGGAATFGFDDLKDVTHILENQLDRVRKGRLALRADMVDTFLEAGDALKAILHAHQVGQGADQSVSANVCTKLHALEQGGNGRPGSVTPRWHLQLLSSAKAADDVVRLGLENVGWIRDEADPTGMRYVSVGGDSVDQILEMLAFLLAPGDFQLSQQSAISEDDGFGLFTDDAAARESDDAGFGFFWDEMPSKIDDIDGFGLFETSFSAEQSPSELEGFGLFEVAQVPPEIARKSGPATETASAVPPLIERRAVPRPSGEAGNAPESSSIRVAVEKVDQIINLVGELVITQAMLAQLVGELDPATHERLNNGIALLERNTRELQESAMSIRMMPISFVFSRFPRLVRDTAAKLGKQVKLVTHGEGTELDRGLIERLADPLTHLVRNSLDHGIESSEARLAKGKDEHGTLTLRAFHQGGNIIIQVQDDGAGLSRERILAKAMSQAMNVSQDMPDAEVWGLIFEPGFSTAEVVTEVSGRGVGMDVVRRNIQGMGGRIEIDSVKDAGTTMTIRLPLTLAILDGMAVRVGAEVYVIPLAFIVESLQPRALDVKSVSGRGRVVNVRGEYLPIITLQQVFGTDDNAPQSWDGLFVILESESGKTALFVDDLLGQHQIVIKSLETNFRKVAGISGATVMGDGRVALIMDVESLVRLGLHPSRDRSASII